MKVTIEIKDSKNFESYIKSLQWVIDNKVTVNYVRKLAILEAIELMQKVIDTQKEETKPNKAKKEEKTDG